MDFPPFPGFRPQAFDFLRELAQNNDRDWFKPRKSTYEDELLWPMQCLIEDCSRRAAAQNLPLSGDPKKSVFRIYRDTRFSKDKRPYKTACSAFFSPSGQRNDGLGGVYIHLEPDQSFLGAGFWRPEQPFVNRWRARMAEDPEGFLDIARHLESRGLALSQEDTLKRLPRGYEAYAEHGLAGFLRLKSFTVGRRIADDAMRDPGFASRVVDMMHDVHPFLEYGWQFKGASR
ncbi:MAG TPA: DUF2461 domain-containing protein [Rhodothermales bacterium]|nr:DUF2461 domain-containing protein [Rhodothermales bacterium]